MVGAWERAQVLAIELNPGVRSMGQRFHRQPDHEFRRIPLFTEKAVEHQGVGEACGAPGTEVQGT